MIEIDIILGNRCVPPWREGIICMSGGLVLIVAKSVLANCGTILGIMAWSVQAQLDDGGENS
jgi:hypothetical protein